MHGKPGLLKSLIAHIHAGFLHATDAAEQFEAADLWAELPRYASDKTVPTVSAGSTEKVGQHGRDAVVSPPQPDSPVLYRHRRRFA